MTESTAVRDALSDALSDIEPSAFHSRCDELLAAEPLTPGVLTLRTARALDPSVTTEAGAIRGAGVQLSYEGLRLTRRIIRERKRDALARATNGAGSDAETYYLDLLAAEVMVSRGFYQLATTGVSDQAVEIVRRFGRNQTIEHESGIPEAPSLEVDVIKLAVNAGADLANVPLTPALTSFGERLADELEAEPLPDPEPALSGIESRIQGVTSHSEVPEADRR